MRKFLILFVALTLFCAMFTGAMAEQEGMAGIFTGDIDGILAGLETWDDELAPTEAPVINTIATTFEGIQMAYTVAIDGTTYAMPFPMQSLLDAGWSAIDEYQSMTMDPMTYFYASMSNPAGQSMTVYFMNADPANEISFAQSEVFSIKIDDPTIDFAMGSGIRIGDNIDSVIAAYGDGYTENPVTDGGRVIFYNFYDIWARLSDSIQSQVNVKGNFSDELRFWSGPDGKINKIEIENTIFGVN